MERDDFSRLPSRSRRGDVLWPLIFSFVLCLALVAFVAVPVFVVADPYLSPTDGDVRHCETQADQQARNEVGHTGSSDLISYRAHQIYEHCLDRRVRMRVGYEGVAD